MTLNGRRFLALALRGWLFVELTPANLGEHAGFFAGTLKTPHSDFKWLVFFDANVGHRTESLAVSG